jgi:predicted unusual protein kinase regulating ubiquinone biosynthesis (AarF/ABC1/UbiB family)
LSDADGWTARANSFFGEMRRMARTSGAVGGIAARVAGERFLGIKTDKAAHANDLKALLGGLKGPLMKVAQFLSTVPNALPRNTRRSWRRCRPTRRRWAGPSSAAAWPLSWARNWQSRFASFGQEAAAAASLGQVHRATAAGWHAGRLQAAIPGHAERGGGRPSPAEARHGHLPPAWTSAHPA